MKKAFNFRSVIICALVLILCLTAFVACDKDKDGQDNNLANFENAKSQVYNLYKSLDNTSQTADIYLYSTLVREDGTYTITWTYTVTAGPAENISVVESDKENMIKFHVNTEATEATTVVIKGVIKDSHGNQANVAENGFTITIPKCEYASFEEYVAMCKENGGSVSATSKTCAVRGFVIGVNGNGSSMGSVWIMDSKGNGYYAFKPKYQNNEDATRESLNEYLPIGTEVIVRGTPMLAFNSTLEFNKNCTIEKTGNTAEEKGVSLDYLDVTEAWGNATSITDTALEKYQARRVELKNIVMGEKSGNDFYFTVNGVEFIFRSNIYLMTNEESDALAAKWVAGGKANIKGIVNVYSSKYQVYPDSVNSIEVLTQTDAEVVAGVKAALNLEESYKADFTLPTSTIATITWTVSGEGAVIGENNAVTITRTDEEQTVVFTATIVKGDATDTATFTVKIPANEVVDPNTVILTTESLGLVKEKYQESPEAGVTVNGVTFSFEEVGFYDAGIQTRNKNGKGTKIWNTTATNKPIAKLIVKIYDGKAGFSNNDTHTITFGNAVNGSEYSTTLSTVKDQYEYEIIPDAATYTFFTFAHNASYTYSSYFESITVVYAQEVVKTDAEKVAEIKAGLELATTTTATDFDLPTTDVEGATITWTVDHTEIITFEGNLAKVTAPAEKTKVKLTATITVGEATDTKEFPVTITVTIPEYDVTVGTLENGELTVTVDGEAFTGGKLQQGKELVIAVTVNEGYEIVEVKVNDTALTVGTDGKYTYTVNDAPLNITAKVREIKYATVTVGTVENGTLDVKVGDAAVEADKQYRDGTVLTITATANAGYKLVAIKVNDEAITGTTYTIKETDTALEITAEFAEKYEQVTIENAYTKAKGDAIKITGVVTMIDPAAIYVQDGDFAFYIYTPNTFEGVEVGKKVTFGGTVDIYNDLYELKAPELLKVEEGTAVVATTITEVPTDKVNAAKLVNANALEFVSQSASTNKSGAENGWNVTAKLNDTNITVHMLLNNSKYAELKALFANMTAGDKFNLTNVNIGWYKGAQIALTNVDSVEVVWNLTAVSDKSELVVDGTATITATITPAFMAEKVGAITFRTSDDQVLTVDYTSGAVTAVGVGEDAYIIVSVGGKTVNVPIVVKATASAYTVTYSVTGENGTIASVMAGETAIESGVTTIPADTKITVTVAPADGYRLASVTVGEGEADTSVAGKTSFELTITADTTFTVAFEVIPSTTTVTAKYTGSTTNMQAGANNAATIGLDATIFSVTSAKTGGSVEVGLNKDGTIRLYKGSTTPLTITVAAGYEIVSIKVTLGTTKGTLVVSNGTDTIAEVSGVYTINGSKVVLNNTNTSSQCHIQSIEITYKTVA